MILYAVEGNKKTSWGLDRNVALVARRVSEDGRSLPPSLAYASGYNVGVLLPYMEWNIMVALCQKIRLDGSVNDAYGPH